MSNLEIEGWFHLTVLQHGDDHISAFISFSWPYANTACMTHERSACCLELLCSCLPACFPGQITSKKHSKGINLECFVALVLRTLVVGSDY